MEPTDFEQLYREGNPPWDHGEHDFNLANVVNTFSIQACKALDLGCGMGNNTIWLAKNGFKVTGFDLSETAIAQASARMADAGVDCTLQAGDFLCDPIPTAPFGFVFDRGCLHCIPEQGDKETFAENVAEALVDGGYWLSLIGNADELERENGPPQLKVQQIAAVVEAYFEIQSITAGVFGDKQEDPPKAWICLMRKRG